VITIRKFGLRCLTVSLSALFSILGCSTAKDPWADVPGGPPRVLTTFPPLYCFAANVAGDKAAVLSLLDQTGPHGFEPRAEDALKLRKANLLLVNGLGLDDFIGRLVKQSANKSLAVVDLGKKLEDDHHELLLPMAEHKHENGGGHKHHHHGEHDPHVWLGIPQAVEMVKIIKKALQEKAPANAAAYEKNAADYVKELEGLQEEGKKQLKAKKNRKLITHHESLAYFADSFGLEIVGSIQIRPGVEADASQRARLVKLCKEKGVRVIAVEPQYSKESAEALQKQLRRDGIELEIVEVDPLETARGELGPDFYVTKMRENISKLAKALK
jgi:zinc transport system substrate-binding protein